ncbi:MAG: hypothetical protein ACE5IY_11425 [bacterium]
MILANKDETFISQLLKPDELETPSIKEQNPNKTQTANHNEPNDRRYRAPLSCLRFQELGIGAYLLFGPLQFVISSLAPTVIKRQLGQQPGLAKK